MGYTHYWYRQQEIDRDKFKAIVQDFNKLVQALDTMGVKLAGGNGSGEPELTGEMVCFNGLEKCGHTENKSVVIPWPSKGATGVMEPNAKGIAGSWFAGASLDTRICNGDCSYETFYFPRVFKPDYKQPHEKHSDLLFSCTKTAYRPYDVAVTAFLIIAKKHLGEDVIVSSDGEDEQWYDAKKLCWLNGLGYGPEFGIDPESGDLERHSGMVVDGRPQGRTQ